MKNKINLFCFLGVVTIMSCNQQQKNICKIDTFKELNLYPVNTILKIPPFLINDSIIYTDHGGLSETVLNYNVSLKDTSLHMVLFVNDYGTNKKTPLEYIASFQKKELEYGKDSIKLLNEIFKTFDTVKVGYLKYYFENNHYKSLQSRLFFYRDNKLTICWFRENFRNTQQLKSSTSDCIFQNLLFK